MFLVEHNVMTGEGIQYRHDSQDQESKEPAIAVTTDCAAAWVD